MPRIAMDVFQTPPVVKLELVRATQNGVVQPTVPFMMVSVTIFAMDVSVPLRVTA